MKKINHLLNQANIVLKKDGVFSLAKHIAFFLQKLINDYIKCLLLPSKDVLYVTGCAGGSEYYRCFNQKEELNQFGLSAAILSQKNNFLHLIVKKYKIFIFQRVHFNHHISVFLNELKKNNKIIIYETDDLIFDPDYLKYMAYYDEMEEREKVLYRNGIGRELLEEHYIHHVVVSTDFLGKIVNRKYPEKRVFLSENKLSHEQVKWSRHVLNNNLLKSRDDLKLRIAYFSGTHSHNRDFMVVSKVLKDILKNNKNIILMIVGYLDISNDFKEVSEQIEFYHFTSLNKLPELINKSDINIAPLELDNPFCQAKSAIKYLEAGLLKIPTIASATEPYKSVITNGDNGFLATTDRDWKKYLMYLINNTSERIHMGERAYKNIYQKHVIPNLVEPSVFVEFINKEIQYDNN